MARSTGKYEMDMTNGPLLKQIIRFSIPLMLTGILQLLFNAADVVVVGNFSSREALAAVTSTGSLINLIINVFIGLSVGAGVVVAQEYGANSYKDVQDTIHTSIAIGLIGGTVLGIFGVVMAKPLLELMSTPEDVLDLAALYMRIYFVGMPATLLYNFCSAIFRAVGDTKRPLYYLSIAGILNVILNLFFVIVCGMSVEGVAIATVVSQCVSLVLTLLCMMRSDGFLRLRWKEVRIDWGKLGKIVKVGLPAGLQGSLFSISNVMIQASVNSFGSLVMAGNGAAANIEGFVYNSMNAVYQAAITFTGQNMGARRYERINKILGACLLVVTTIGLIMGVGGYLLGDVLLRVYTQEPDVIAMGKIRLGLVCLPYFLCGIMDVLVGSMRGMGRSVVPMLVSILGVCGVRILWIQTVFAWDHNLQVLYWSYPLSWAATALVHFICFLFIHKKIMANAANAQELPVQTT